MRNNKSATDKLTALWALNESGLGGFLHVFNSPFTGLIVGGIAILLISLIAYYAENKWQAILKALIIVLIIKMAVSPYSPFAAYIAVAFQAVVGAFLFTNFSWKGFMLVFYGLITFLQSAVQKLIVLTIVYGTEIWEAINIYGTWVKSKFNFITEASSTSILVTFYLLVYGIGGILAGFFIKSMLKIISEKKHEELIIKSSDLEMGNKTKKAKFRYKIVWVWLATVLVIVLAFYFFGGPMFGFKKGIYIILRSFLVLMIWYLILGPFLLKLIKRYLNKKESKYKEDINNAMDLFPYLKHIILRSWSEAKHLKGYNRFKHFMANSISNSIHFKPSEG